MTDSVKCPLCGGTFDEATGACQGCGRTFGMAKGLDAKSRGDAARMATDVHRAFGLTDESTATTPEELVEELRALEARLRAPPEACPRCDHRFTDQDTVGDNPFGLDRESGEMSDGTYTRTQTCSSCGWWISYLTGMGQTFQMLNWGEGIDDRNLSGSHCAGCKKTLLVNARFCTYCGERVSGD